MIPHFVGASPDSTSLRRTFSRLCTRLNLVLESPSQLPETIRRNLCGYFLNYWARPQPVGRVLIILDAVNQFEKADFANAMGWLPPEPARQRAESISTLSGVCLDALLDRVHQPKLERITGLNRAEIREMVRDYLNEIRHDFPNQEVADAFFEKGEERKPVLYSSGLGGTACFWSV